MHVGVVGEEASKKHQDTFIVTERKRLSNAPPLLFDWEAVVLPGTFKKKMPTFG